MRKHYLVAKEELAFYGEDCTSLQNLLAVLIGPKAEPAVTGQLASLGVNGLMRLSKEDLLSYPSIGETSANRIISAFGIAHYIKKYQKESSYKINSPGDAAKYFSDLEDLNQEHFDVLFLNTKFQVIARKNIFKGSLNASIVHPREVFREAIRVSAAAIIVAHNHPSHDPSPSREDLEVSRRLVEVGKTVGIELLDSLVIGGNGRYVSLKEKGHI